jgi:hypothetical protein
MNTLDALNGDIKATWDQLKEVTRREDWPATQQEFRKLAAFLDFREQFQRRLPAISSEPNSHTIREALITPRLSQKARRAIIRPRELTIGSFHVPISLNNQIVIATANWILKQGKSLPRIENFIHPNDTGFSTSAQIRQLDDGSFIEIGDSQSTLMQKARRLLNACGFHQVKIEVLLEDGIILTA